jgi:hypothetical protein
MCQVEGFDPRRPDPGDAAGAGRHVRQALASKAPSTDDAEEEQRWRGNGRFFLAQLIASRPGPSGARAEGRDPLSTRGVASAERLMKLLGAAP